MQRVHIGRGEHRDGAHSQPLGSAGDTAGNFAAVGNQDGIEHRELMTERMICSSLTGCGVAPHRH